jgi:hypothetical protein
VSAIAWGPTVTSLAAGDAPVYALYAGAANPFANPQHPVGYPVLLWLIGLVTRDVTALVLAQHVMSVAAAIMLFAAFRRLSGSPWPGIAGAAVVLLGADHVHLERAIMAETLFLALVAAAMYAFARVLDNPSRWWAWSALLALLVVCAGATRSAGLVLLPVVMAGLALPWAGPWRWRRRALGVFAITAGTLLVAYAGAGAAVHGRIEVAPAGGWHLYGRVAPFADCRQLSPLPDKGEQLCERTAPADRPGTDWYLYWPEAPAWKTFGSHPADHDGELGAFARRVVLRQPGAYARAVWDDLSAYFVPASFEGALEGRRLRPALWTSVRGAHLDDQLDWNGPAYPTIAVLAQDRFFDDFSVYRDVRLTAALHDYQRVFRFGATALTLATLLILAGLFVGPRRDRLAVFIPGLGGLAMLVLPTLAIIYIARYTVPVAPLLAAGATAASRNLIASLRRAFMSPNDRGVAFGGERLTRRAGRRIPRR